MQKKALLFSLAAFCLGGAALADSPFDGTWKLDAAKSHLTGDTMTLEDAGGGSMKYTDSDQSYTFKPDGSPFTTPTGSDRTFSKNADGSYTVTVKLHGALLRTNTWTPSSDGNSMTIESKGTKPNGDTFDGLSGLGTHGLRRNYARLDQDRPHELQDGGKIQGQGIGHPSL
jgi:hypothetical protein